MTPELFNLAGSLLLLFVGCFLWWRAYLSERSGVRDAFASFALICTVIGLITTMACWYKFSQTL